jgi:hypothetical protein
MVGGSAGIDILKEALGDGIMRSSGSAIFVAYRNLLLQQGLVENAREALILGLSSELRNQVEVDSTQPRDALAKAIADEGYRVSL